MAVVAAAAAAAIDTLSQAACPAPCLFRSGLSVGRCCPLAGWAISLQPVSSLWKLTHRHAACSLGDSRSQQVDSQDKLWYVAWISTFGWKSCPLRAVFSNHAEEPVPAKASLPVPNEASAIAHSLDHLSCSFVCCVPLLKSVSHKP